MPIICKHFYTKKEREKMKEEEEKERRMERRKGARKERKKEREEERKEATIFENDMDFKPVVDCSSHSCHLFTSLSIHSFSSLHTL